ncbi:ficolin-2-like [Crassostrea virginica]
MEFWFFVVLSTLHLVTVMCYDSVHGERYIGPVVMIINLVGQKQCIQKCLERPSVCKGVNYSRQNLLCELVTATEMTEQRSGYVRVGLSQTDLTEPGCTTCSSQEVCVTLSSKASHCLKDDKGPIDCTGIHKSHPGVVSGLYAVELPVMGHVTVFCDMETDGGGWTVFQRRMDGSEDFVRTWLDYKNGFGNQTSEFWLGNDNLHYLLSQGNYELRYDMADFENETRYVKYSSFSVGDEASKYTVSVSGYSGDVGDCFTRQINYINNMKFSTFDNDNDRVDGSCASSHYGGWWYNQCHCANPNGLYLRGANDQPAKGMTYAPFRSQSYSLKSVTLMVRRFV